MTNLERETTEEFSKDAEAEKKTSKTQSHQGGKKTGINHANADALLLAEYARRIENGRETQA